MGGMENETGELGGIDIGLEETSGQQSKNSVRDQSDDVDAVVQ